MAKAASLAAASGVLAKDFQLPASFSPPSAPIEGRTWAPSLSFAHPNKNDEWAKLRAKYPNVADGDTFLIETKGVTALPTFRASIFTYRQYWCMKDATGKMTATSDKEMPKPWAEHVEAALFLFLPDRGVPANCTFKTAKCPAARVLSEALAEAGVPAWADKSELHKQTLVCPQPWMRFFGECTVKPPRTPKGGGRPYRTCDCNLVQATTASEWKLIKDFAESADAQELFRLVVARFESQVAEVVKLQQK